MTSWHGDINTVIPRLCLCLCCLSSHRHKLHGDGSARHLSRLLINCASVCPYRAEKTRDKASNRAKNTPRPRNAQKSHLYAHTYTYTRTTQMQGYASPTPGAAPGQPGGPPLPEGWISQWNDQYQTW